MARIPMVLGIFVLLLMPVYASGQTPDRIVLLDNFGDYDRGAPLFIYGKITTIVDDSFLVLQIFNPQGDLCQIQQLLPLSDGSFVTDVIPLKGRICGISGDYEIKLFYGDYSKSTMFTVSPSPYIKPGNEQMVASAQSLIDSHSEVIGTLHDIDSPITDSASNDLSQLQSDYVGLLNEFYVDDFIIEINPLIRPAISSSLDSVQNLLDDDEISFEIAESIYNIIFTSVFYYEIGDKTKSIDLLTDAFIDIKNVNPEKVKVKKVLTFDELEATLLNLMTKSGTVMSKAVKNEIGFIFARGTVPLYAQELDQLVDILSKSRYLDVVSRKQSDLYRLVQNDWESLKASLMEKPTIEELVESSVRVSELHQASILLRELDNVDRFISSDPDENGDLAILIEPLWSKLESKLSLATSVEDILESKSQINQMVQVIDISSRISKSVEISQINGVNLALVDDWGSLLERVDAASSIDDILEIVSEFDQSMTELREKRSPLKLLEFRYNTMRGQAQIQADYENLFLIDSALRIIDTAKQMESGNPSISRIDRIEVLLSWASDISVKIQSDLDAYNKDAYKLRAGDILQRTKSLENLVELSLTKKRFLPNYVEFTEKFNEKLDRVRDLVIQTELDQADNLVRDLFGEWSAVSKAYTDDPHGSSVGYSVDEIKRIEFRKKLDTFSKMVSTFNNAGFSQYVSEYNKKMADAYQMVDLANFIDAESKITEIGDYLSEHLVLDNDRIMYDISFDPEKTIWVISGATDKPVFDRRENIYVTVYNMDGTTHSSLEFTDTKQGNFFTQWFAPTDPGLYIVMLQYQNSKASQIVHVEEDFEYEYNETDMSMVELARDFEELKSFAEKFGGNNYSTNPRFASVINEIKLAINDKDADDANDNIRELKTIIERYLPVRNPTAPIQAHYDGEQLVISGRVLKAVAFSEDLYIDIYDQRGDKVIEIALRDDPTGLFNEVVTKSFDNGSYVVQLQYHGTTVTDFFNVP